MKVYIKVDEQNRVFPCCEWFAGIEPDPDWILVNIAEGTRPYEEHGVCLWKYVNGELVSRSSQEIMADINAIPIPEPTPEEILRADVDYLLMITEDL